MIQKWMMTNSLAKSLEGPITSVRDRFTAPSVQENTPKRTAKTNSTANLSPSTTSERISLDLQVSNTVEVNTTEETTTQDSKDKPNTVMTDTIAMTGITPNPHTAKADTIIDLTQMRDTLIAASPKLTRSHLNTRVGAMM